MPVERFIDGYQSRNERMADLIHEVSERYRDRFIIVDSPPPKLTAETFVLASQVDGVVLVVKYGSTPRDMVADLIAKMGKDGKSVDDIQAAIVEADRKAELDDLKAQVEAADKRATDAEAALHSVKAEVITKVTAAEERATKAEAKLAEFEKLGSQRTDPGPGEGKDLNVKTADEVAAMTPTEKATFFAADGKIVG